MMRALQSVKIFLFLFEKGYALAFPTLEWKFDYRGFTAEDELSHRWCRDLFQLACADQCNVNNIQFLTGDRSNI